jgi:hypothetical protein
MNNQTVLIVTIIAGTLGLAVVIVLLIFAILRGLASKAKLRVAARWCSPRTRCTSSCWSGSAN